MHATNQYNISVIDNWCAYQLYYIYSCGMVVDLMHEAPYTYVHI